MLMQSWEAICQKSAEIDMFPFSGSPPVLRVKRPTPTTVLFTVSTAPSSETISQKAFLYLSHCVRFSFVLLVISLFYAKWHLLSGGPDMVAHVLAQSSLGQMVFSIAEDSDWRYLVSGGLLVLWLSVRRGYTGTFLWLPFSRIV